MILIYFMEIYSQALHIYIKIMLIAKIIDDKFLCQIIKWNIFKKILIEYKIFLILQLYMYNKLLKFIKFKLNDNIKYIIT